MIDRNSAHSSPSDRRDHFTVTYYTTGPDGTAQFLATEHVVGNRVEDFQKRQKRSGGGGGGGGGHGRRPGRRHGHGGKYIKPAS